MTSSRSMLASKLNVVLAFTYPFNGRIKLLIRLHLVAGSLGLCNRPFADVRKEVGHNIL